MTERLNDQWVTRDFPVLREVVRLMDEQPLGNVRLEQVQAALPQVTPDQLQQAAVNLQRAGLVNIAGASGIRCLRFTDVSERALRVAGIWPDEQQAADQLLWILEQKVDQSVTPEERSRWVKIRDSIGYAGRDFAVELAAAMATRQIGG